MRRLFSDLDALVDHGHSFLREVEGAPQASGFDKALGYARVVVHEWLANLVQYADFDGRQPQVVIQVQIGRTGLRFAIDDNSSGFDFNASVHARRKALSALPHRGLGLLMIAACTDELAYDRFDSSRHRLAFSIPAEQDPILEIPFEEETAFRQSGRA